MPEKGAWTVCRFKGGPDKKEGGDVLEVGGGGGGMGVVDTSMNNMVWDYWNHNVPLFGVKIKRRNS